MTESQRTLAQIQRFIIVSGVALVIDMALYMCLTTAFDLDSSWAKRISFACIPVWGFFAHKRYTFSQRLYNPGEPIRFACVYLIGWALNSLVHDATTMTLGQPSLPAFIAATVAWACLNFAGQKWFVFSSNGEQAYQYSKARRLD